MRSSRRPGSSSSGGGTALMSCSPTRPRIAPGAPPGADTLSMRSTTGHWRRPAAAGARHLVFVLNGSGQLTPFVCRCATKGDELAPRSGHGRLPLYLSNGQPRGHDAGSLVDVPGRSQLEVRSGLCNRRASGTLRAIVDEAAGITRVGSPGGIAPPGSHRSQRDSLPSPGSSHQLSVERADRSPVGEQAGFSFEQPGPPPCEPLEGP